MSCNEQSNGYHNLGTEVGTNFEGSSIVPDPEVQCVLSPTMPPFLEHFSDKDSNKILMLSEMLCVILDPVCVSSRQ